MDQIFSSSEHRLAAILLLLAGSGLQSNPEPQLVKVSHEHSQSWSVPLGPQVLLVFLKQRQDGTSLPCEPSFSEILAAGAVLTSQQ